MMWPWLDGTGRFDRFKAVVFALVLLPALWLAWRAGVAGLGPRPWTEAIHQSGDWAIRFLFLSLAVTPIRAATRWAPVMTVRRMLGLTALAYTLLHLGLYVGDQALDLVKVAGEIATRFYLTIGFVALLGLAALGVTSTNRMIKRLGGSRWRALHKLVYPLAILGLLHFFLQSKLDATEPVLMAGALLWLFGVRLIKAADWKVSPSALALLALVVAPLTAVAEAVWFHLKAGAPIGAVLQANLMTTLGVRPSVWVLAAGLVIAAAAWLYRRGPTARQPMSRRQNPSGQSMASTA